MADDGMFLNFEIGSGPLKPAVKLVGGRWRDRSRAKREQSQRLQHLPAEPRVDRRVGEDETGHADLPPAKRVKKNHTSSAALPETGTSESSPHGPDGDSGSAPRPSKAQPTAAAARQVTSRLFTSNPTPRTVFGEPDVAWTAPAPSNAPVTSAPAFAALGLAPRLADELARMNLDKPTAIQRTVIPHMLSTGTDAFVQAETGSGKTFSYLLPIVHRVLRVSEGDGGVRLHRNSGLFAIIVAPTRELAKQTQAVLCQLLRPFPWLVSSAITGGESKKAEKARFRKGVNFLVATPGRLADHLDNTKALNFRTVRWLVLDEGDRLMELGFEEDLEKVISCLRRVEVAAKSHDGASLAALPDRRVTILCSATMRVNVQRLGEMSLEDATYLETAPREGAADTEGPAAVLHKAPDQLHQSFVVVPAKLRLVTLISQLKNIFSRRCPGAKVMVFISCADSVDFHFALLKLCALDDSQQDSKPTPCTAAKAAYLTSPATPVVALHRLHGSLSQSSRTTTLRSFVSSDVPAVLLTTDISSRGLDIPSVDTVIEYDPAFSFADHIHRVGRTARAGRAGDAVLFLQPGCEEGYLELVKSSSSLPTAQSFEKIMQQGVSALEEYPFETYAKAGDGRSYAQKAESLQLHLEQRLLADNHMLQLARNGFKSHIRAYATHVKEERCHFDMSELHLGHVAKAFGLREAPAGIGGAVERRVAKKAANQGRKHDNTQESMRASRDAITKKSRSMMTGADEFNLG